MDQCDSRRTFVLCSHVGPRFAHLYLRHSYIQVVSALSVLADTYFSLGYQSMLFPATLSTQENDGTPAPPTRPTG